MKRFDKDYLFLKSCGFQEIHSETTSSPPRDNSDSSINSEIAGSSQNEKQSEEEDTDSFNLVTCFCGKPFAGRPMIECLECLTWIHLSCARIKKNNIPEVSTLNYNKIQCLFICR